MDLTAGINCPTTQSICELKKHILDLLYRSANYHEFVRDINFDNSTAIFNSIRAASRQSPSDIHPVGVSCVSRCRFPKEL
nr:CFF_HP1_G0040680.mRNA.1.CDS.1 [Saccharomyces cerevisiae]